MKTKAVKSKKQLEKIECTICGGNMLQHKCVDCNDDITKKECKDFNGICDRCIWLLDK